MTTQYQKRIMTLGNVFFKNIEDADIIWFEQWDGGHDIKCFYHLYTSKGELKDIKIGYPIPMTELKFDRPTKRPRKITSIGEDKESNKIFSSK